MEQRQLLLIDYLVITGSISNITINITCFPYFVRFAYFGYTIFTVVSISLLLLGECICSLISSGVSSYVSFHLFL